MANPLMKRGRKASMPPTTRPATKIPPMLPYASQDDENQGFLEDEVPHEGAEARYAPRKLPATAANPQAMMHASAEMR